MGKTISWEKTLDGQGKGPPETNPLTCREPSSTALLTLRHQPMMQSISRKESGTEQKRGH